MSTYFARGGVDVALSDDELRQALCAVFEQLGQRHKVLALPSDFTRMNSYSGQLTCMTEAYFGEALTDVLPALGTHEPMSDAQLDAMFPTLPRHKIRVHDWRNAVITIGETPAEFVREATEGIYTNPWPAQLNKLVWEGGHDLILSLGQVVPHEVIGMANYTKNLFVGVGGADGINQSHFISAVYGMERIMGRADNPLRRILNYAYDTFCQHLPIVFVLTVVGPDANGGLVRRGLYIGNDTDCFEQAAALSLKVNFTLLDEAPTKMVVYLDPSEFHSTWLGNKSIYRTRMAIADGGTLVVLAPGVEKFGEDPEIDRLIRKYGYCTRDIVLRNVARNEDLRNNLSAAAHLSHGSPENRFKIIYCPVRLSRAEIECVGFTYAEPDTMLKRYPPDRLKQGWNIMPDGEKIYYIGNPALGLWARRSAFTS